MSARVLTAEQRARQREYNAKPESKARQHEYNAKPETKARQREHNAKPENKAKRREYNAKPENRERNRRRHDMRPLPGSTFFKMAHAAQQLAKLSANKAA